jgi:1,5-anhydro-D-fructose reductase (1,5-anhydro-D-mannitol-forming)
MINVGIIGYGKMGQIRNQVIDSFDDVKVVSIFDTAKISAEAKIVDSPDKIIKDPDIDSVIISTPNYLNKNLTMQSLENGKNVFCEKPPAFNSIEVEEICQVEKKSGKKLMYGFNHRHHSSIKRMKEMVDGKEFGKVLWMRGRYGKSVDKAFYNNWRAKKKYAGGGILIDQGIHMLDLFLYLGGDFDKVQASVSNLYWKLNVEDNVFATLENTKTGMAASLHSTMTQWRHLFSLEVFLEKGYLILNGLKTSSNTYGDEILTITKNRSVAPAATWEDEENITFHNDESWESELNEFFYSIKNNKKIKSGNSYDALKLMRIVDQIYSYKKK